MKWRVTYEVLGKTMALEYADRAEAEVHRRDVAGFEGVSNCQLEGPLEGEPRGGPFEVEGPKTRYDVLSD